MDKTTPGEIVLVGAQVSMIIAWDNGMPSVLHWGSPIAAGDQRKVLPSFRAALDRPVPRGGLDVDPPLGIITTESAGFSGQPGLLGHRPDGSAWSPFFELAQQPTVDGSRAKFALIDRTAGLRIDIDVEIDDADAVVVRTELMNIGDTDYTLTRLAPSLPVGAQAVELQTFAGRWSFEFQPQRTPFTGLTTVENRRGRTSHDRLPALFAGTSAFSEHLGEVWGAQLGWSGNFEVSAEALIDGRRHLQLGELLAPGEMVLQPGDRYQAPPVVGAYASDGLNQCSTVFHRHVRSFPNQPGIDRPRPVVLNTWEAVYFDHDLDRLKALADVAATVGVERFVLDDGWFGSRRDDTSGLGDWVVSGDVWPDGLGPLIDHVVGLGMEFGLWFEPEMVNPDSELYRSHPEWTLTTDGYEPVLGRQQLVLNLGLAEVSDYLFDQISSVLGANQIRYVKWDMNRDMVQGSSVGGRAGTHDHVVGLYSLLSRLRRAHPQVEFESCSSGGGRADLGILRHTERIWTSDCNDALDRQAIQRGFSMLFPPEVMGAHLGPTRAHTTDRRQRLGFRLATALFGHFGIEWNLLDASAEERATISDAIELYKRLRPLLHGGDVVRLDSLNSAVVANGVMSPDQSVGCFAYAQVATLSTTIGTPLRLAGLAPEHSYRVRVLTEVASAAEFGRTRPGWMDLPNFELSGAALMSVGLQPPVLHPESVLLVEVEQVQAN